MSLLSFQLYINYLSAFITFITSFAASSDPRTSVNLVAGHIYPSSRASRQIMRIIKLQLHKEGYTWDAVPQEARDFYWEEFQVYGIGSQASQFYCGSACHASTANAGPQLEHSAKEFTALRVRVDDQQRQIAELRAHVMRLSDQPGAGTSSSDPAPATDRNVSTSQQQPLLSPDPNVADDTLVTPPGTIAHPAGTPPGDSTLDRADDQPRGFDFGPF
ncbi:hypothetical protein JCGZ_17164 [Jatropha curcas]|uniref:Uncharacterized protein n=1 Tax=Jatropha curcas TaxID=180498 RepID=A0A067KEN2_JATCU|nr:hypothetical protein JCGZ_17164 [Jatropha curcas]